MGLDDLAPPPSAPVPGESSRLWEGTILNVVGDGLVMVALPGADAERHAQGPCRFMPNGGMVPAKGDHCLVAIDDDGEPWVAAWTPATSRGHSLEGGIVGVALEEISDYLATVSTDDRSETMVHGVRRAIEVRVPLDAVRIAGTVEDYIGQVDAVEDPTGDPIEGQLEASATKRFNSTAAGFALQFQSLYAQHPNTARRRLVVDRADHIARTLLAYQYVTAGTLRRGGFRLAPTDSRATAFGTGVAGRGMLYCFKVTGNSAWLASARSAADFLLRLASPNDYWQPTYGISPLVNPTGALCDRVDGSDKLTTTSSTLNLVAAAFLLEMADFIGDATPEAAAISDPYRVAAFAARDFMDAGVLGGYDFFAHDANVGDGTYVSVAWPNLTSLVYEDDAWHRLGDGAGTGTHGTDGTEYGIQALYQMGYPVQPLRDRWEYVANLIFPSPANTFQTAFNAALGGRICLTGYLRFVGGDRPYADYLDSQGAMTLAEFKAAEFPDDFAASLPILLEATHHGSLLNMDGDTVFSDGGTYKRATKGVLPIAQAGIGLLKGALR